MNFNQSIETCGFDLLSIQVLDNLPACCTFSWTCKSLAAAIGLPVDTLQRRVNFWISKVGPLIIILTVSLKSPYKFLFCVV